MSFDRPADDRYHGEGGGSPEASFDAFSYLAEDVDAGDDVLAQVGGGVSAQPADAGLPLDAPAPAPAPGTAEDRHPSQTATTEQLADPNARKNLDLDWLDDARGPVRDSIDRSYSDGDAAKKKKSQKTTESARMKREMPAKKRELRKSVAEKLGFSDDKAHRTEIDDSEDYTTGVATIEAENQERLTALDEDVDQNAPVADRKQTVVGIDEKTTTREAGKTLNRTNFMSIMTKLMKHTENGKPESSSATADRVKKHYKGIGPVPGTTTWLAEDARTRYMEARKKFDEENPGYTLPVRGGGFDTRDLHQAKNGIGKFGHILGEAIDFDPEAMPNLRGLEGEEPGLNAFMLRKFGGKGGAEGLSQMSISETAIERVGQHNKTGTLDGKDKDVLKEVTKQYGQISDTSNNFVATSKNKMPALATARETYFELPDKRKALRQLDKDIRAAKSPDEKQKLNDTRAALDRQIRKDDGLVSGTLGKTFKGERAQLAVNEPMEKTIALAKSVTAKNMKGDLKGFGKMSEADVEAYAKAHGMPDKSTFKKSQESQKSQKTPTYRDAIRAEITKQQESARKSSDYHRGEARRSAALIKRLKDPKAVFGQGKKAKGTWTTAPRTEEVSVMQLMERGFVRNDDRDKVKPSTDPRNPTPIWDTKAVEMMARHGWAPGSNFGDTMHFDYIQGYREAVQGGRSDRENQKEKWTPQDDIVPTTPAPATPDPKRAP